MAVPPSPKQRVSDMDMIRLRHLAKSVKRWTRPVGVLRWLTIFSLSVGAATLAFGGAVLFDMRHDARKQAEQDIPQ
jgi:hypothetical protein